MPRLNQTQINLITKAAVTAEFCGAVIRDMTDTANHDQNLAALEDNALSLALFIREYRRAKHPVEQKGQRA